MMDGFLGFGCLVDLAVGGASGNDRVQLEFSVESKTFTDSSVQVDSQRRDPQHRPTHIYKGGEDKTPFMY